MRQSGVVGESTEAVEGIYSGKLDQTGSTGKLMAEFVRDAAYEAFCLSPRIWQFYEEFWEGPVYLHKCKICPSATKSIGAGRIIGRLMTCCERLGQKFCLTDT